MRRTELKTRSVLRGRLEERRAEIEEAMLARANAIADSDDVSDPAYAEGLRASVSVAFEYTLETIGREGSDPPVPIAMLAQARLAARHGIGIGALLRRYFAGYSLLSYFVVEEAGREGSIAPEELQSLLVTQSGRFDRLLEAIGEEHARESQARLPTSRQRQAEQVERLLAGEMVDTSSIPYDFEGWHLGIVASGEGAQEAIRALAGPRDCRLLSVPREGGTVWAWLGTRRGPETLDLDAVGSKEHPGGVSLALGEPGEGLGGWRLTHRQATAALGVAQRKGTEAVRYGEVALLASVLCDELLTDLLRERYLVPLERERDGGATLHATLRAYFAAGQNHTSAAASLGVNRGTVTYRLQAVEDRIGRPLTSCLPGLAVALELEEFEESPQPCPPCAIR